MKDSHGQTGQLAVACHCACWRCKGGSHCVRCDRFYVKAAPTIVQDYRAYTAEEILYGILESTEQAGWGDPANLGHWLGAAQRWAKGFEDEDGNYDGSVEYGR